MFGIVYKITNNLSGKSYIGITTKTIEERFQAHMYRANIEKSIIQKAIKKYGKENFSIIEIDKAETKEELFEKEKFWIKFFNTFEGYGYNQTIGGDGIVEMSEEIRNKISNSKKGISIPSLKGRNISDKQRIEISESLNGSKVFMYNPETNEEIILRWVNEGRRYGFNPSLISAVCRGKRQHHKGFICRYIKNDANPDLIIEIKKSMAVQRLEGEPQKREYNPSTRSRPLK